LNFFFSNKLIEKDREHFKNLIEIYNALYANLKDDEKKKTKLLRAFYNYDIHNYLTKDLWFKNHFKIDYLSGKHHLKFINLIF
jgi:hypothetical protein